MRREQFACGVVAFAFLCLAPTLSHADQETQADFGMGASARQLRLTRGFAELFAESAPAGTRTESYSVEFARRRNELEFVFGFGYDNLEATNGYYLETGGDPMVNGQVDYTEFDGFHVYSIDATVLRYLEIHKILAVRLGAGLGVGIVRGKILRTDAICSSDNLGRDCSPDPMGAQQREAMDIPPAIPILEGLVGIQFRPLNAVAINIDVGLRNVPYVAASTMLYFW